MSVVSDVVYDRCCVIRLQLDNGTVVFTMSVYLTSQGGYDDLATCLDEFSEVLASRDGNYLCILAGDFNGDIGTRGGGRSNRPPTAQGTLVANFLQKHILVASNLMTVVSGPIHTFEYNASTTLDYIAIPSAIVDRVSESWVSDWHPLNTSDLNIILNDLNLGPSDCVTVG